MTQEPSAVSPSPPELGTLARIVGVIFSPTETFRAVARDPRPAVVLFLVAVAIALATSLPQFTERGRQAALDMQVQTIERFTKQPVPQETYEQMQARSAMAGVWTLIGTFVFLPVGTLFFSALYWFLFNAILGGTATFKQVVGVASHAQVIGALGAVVGAPIMYVTNSFTQTGPFTLSALANFAPPGSFLNGFLSGIGVFPIWGLIVTAIGLGVLYRRKTTGIATFLIAIYLVIVAAFAALLS